MGGGCRLKRKSFFAQVEKGQKLVPLEGLQAAREAFDDGGSGYGKRRRKGGV